MLVHTVQAPSSPSALPAFPRPERHLCYVSQLCLPPHKCPFCLPHSPPPPSPAEWHLRRYHWLYLPLQQGGSDGRRAACAGALGLLGPGCACLLGRASDLLRVLGLLFGACACGPAGAGVSAAGSSLPQALSLHSGPALCHPTLDNADSLLCTGPPLNLTSTAYPINQLVPTQGSLMCTGCTFLENKAPLGGAVALGKETWAGFQGYTFQMNTGMRAGSESSRLCIRFGCRVLGFLGF